MFYRVKNIIGVLEFENFGFRIWDFGINCDIPIGGDSVVRRAHPVDSSPKYFFRGIRSLTRQKLAMMIYY